jgi:predicted AAA+ superfamily ATPase
MTEYLAKLRYYPGDPLEEILIEDLKKLEQQYGVTVSYEKIENREMKEGLLMENTLEKHIEEISQEIITVSGDQRDRIADCIRAIYKKYRCPRTAYSLLGSNEAGQAVAKGLMHLHGGWE